MLSRTVSHGKTPYSWKMTPRSGPGPLDRLCRRAARWPRDRLHEAADDVHHRRLAAARRADDRDELAVADLEVTSSTTRIGPPPAVGKRDRDTLLERDAHRRCGARQSRRHAMRSCQATSRRVAARSARSIDSAIKPMQMMPT